MPEEIRSYYPLRVVLVLDENVIRVVDDGFGGRLAVRAITGIKWENVDREGREYEVVAEIPDDVAPTREVKTPKIRADEVGEFTLATEERFTNENFILRMRPVSAPTRTGASRG